MLQIPRFFRLATLALCVTFHFSTEVRAQGTFNQLPDPMSMGELLISLETYVQLSKEQRTEIETLHDAYKDRFHALRESDIEQFLKNLKEKWNDGLKYEYFDEYVKTLDRLNRQVAEIDDALFDAIGGVLGEGQEAAVQRTRDTRSRARSRVRFRSFSQEYLEVDLSAIVADLRLPKDEQQKVDPILADYEPRLTAAMKDVAKAQLQWFRDRSSVWANSASNKMTPEERENNPEKVQAMRDNSRNAMAKGYEPLRLKSEKLAQLNTTTCKALARQLPDNYRKNFRGKYMLKGYFHMQGVYGGVGGFDRLLRTDVLFRKALRSKTLDEGAREQIAAVYHKWRDDDDALIDQGMHVIDQSRAAIDPVNPHINSISEHNVGIEISKKRTDLGFESLKSVASLLDNPKLKGLFERDANEREPGGVIIMDGMIDDYVDTTEPTDQPPPMSRLAIEEGSPMSDESAEAITVLLSMDESQKALLKSAHADYLNRWDEALGPAIKKLDAVNLEAWAPDKATGEIKRNSDRIIETLALRKAMFTQGTDLDAAFFDDLATVLGEKSCAALSLAKLERALERTFHTDYGYAGSSNALRENRVNIVRILRLSNLAADDRAKAIDALTAQSDQLAKDLLIFYLTGLDLKTEYELQEVADKASHQAGEAWTPADTKSFKDAHKALSDRSRTLILRHKEAIKSAWVGTLEKLDDKQRVSLQMAYDEEANPNPFSDRCPALPYIKKARKLKDLTQEQQAQLSELEERTRIRQNELSRSLTKGSAEIPHANTPEERKEQEAVENAKSKVAYERCETNDAAIRQLRKILTEDQAGRIKGISDFEKTAARIAKAYKER
ncbi:MAG: hypothetical protein K8R92_03390 [Planctomycetes bacterium]|nr:hypothetical protein [Planctomycetota bacterium]